MFKAASLADFHNHHRQFGSFFGAAGIGHDLWSLLNTEEAFTKYAVVTEALDLPAVAGVAKECWPFVQNASPRERKQIATMIGGMIRTVMVANGYSTTGKKRAVPPVLIGGKKVRVFKTGEVYRRV